jgi:acyl carrier protein
MNAESTTSTPNVCDVLTECLAVSPNSIDRDTTLESLGLESIDTLDAAFRIEKLMHVKIDHNDIASLWGGYIPVTGGLAHGSEKIYRRAEPKSDQDIPKPTVGDLEDLIEAARKEQQA